ncbi:MAG: hypothetical protein J6C84_03140 [Lachnospiraceae bacterium]|nr:hypothetical protein [Lachnospiraceae bacterium]
MAINIQAKTDYSYLFSNLGTKNSSGANLNFLSDYAAIKNGSYGKLMKAYYSETGSDAVTNLAKKSNSTTATEEEKKSLAKVDTATDALKESADALLETGKNSVFNKKEITTKDENGVEKTTEDYDTEAIYKAVNSFVNNYNSVISAVDDAGNERVTDKAVSMANATVANIKTLNKLGITMNEDSTLSLNKDTFMKANMDTAKNMFNGAGSYGYRVSAQASRINATADNEASKSSMYNTNGTVNNVYDSGSLFNTLL